MMQMTTIKLVVVCFVGLMVGSYEACAAQDSVTYRQDHVLGTSLELTVRGNSKPAADKAWAAARAEIAALDAVLSTWREDSEISKLNKTGTLAVSDILIDVLSLCETYRADTGGAASCRIGKLINAWRQAKASETVPDDLALAALASTIAAAPLDVATETGRITRPDDVVFVVDAIAKGWILDRAAQAALAADAGIDGVIINIGGDIRVAGDLSGDAPRIGVAGPYGADNEAPMETILLPGGAVASSGGGGRDRMVGGHRFSHILSPQTGWPQANIAVATVVAPTAAEADILSTAFAVMGVGKSLAYANSHDGIEAVLMTRGGARFTSKGWPALLAPVPPQAVLARDQGTTWPTDFTLTIDYEVPRIDASDYQAPYVAVWVTDKSRKLVRSLLLLGNKPRWVEENYRFWRRYGRRHPALIDTVAQPTRPPGQYTLVWDGRDEAGVPVKKGSYTLHIEASREHGGHSYERRELLLADTAVEEIIPIQAELGEVTLHYGPQAQETRTAARSAQP